MTGDRSSKNPVPAEARGRAREFLRTFDADYRHAAAATSKLVDRTHQSGGGRLSKGAAAALPQDWFQATAGPSRVLALDLPRRNAGTGRCATDVRLAAQPFTLAPPGGTEFDENGLEVRGFRLEYGRRRVALSELWPGVLIGFHAIGRFVERAPRIASVESLLSEAALLARWYTPLSAARDRREAPGMWRPPNWDEVATLPGAHGEGAWIGRLATLGIEGGFLPVLAVRTFLDEGRTSPRQKTAITAVAAVDHECREELEEAAAHCLGKESGQVPQDAIDAAGTTLERRR